MVEARFDKQGYFQVEPSRAGPTLFLSDCNGAVWKPCRPLVMCPMPIIPIPLQSPPPPRWSPSPKSCRPLVKRMPARPPELTECRLRRGTHTTVVLILKVDKSFNYSRHVYSPRLPPIFGLSRQTLGAVLYHNSVAAEVRSRIDSTGPYMDIQTGSIRPSDLAKTWI